MNYQYKSIFYTFSNNHVIIKKKLGEIIDMNKITSEQKAQLTATKLKVLTSGNIRELENKLDQLFESDANITHITKASVLLYLSKYPLTFSVFPCESLALAYRYVDNSMPIPDVTNYNAINIKKNLDSIIAQSNDLDNIQRELYHWYYDTDIVSQITEIFEKLSDALNLDFSDKKLSILAFGIDEETDSCSSEPVFYWTEYAKYNYSPTYKWLKYGDFPINLIDIVFSETEHKLEKETITEINILAANNAAEWRALLNSQKSPKSY